MNRVHYLFEDELLPEKKVLFSHCARVVSFALLSPFTELT